MTTAYLLIGSNSEDREYQLRRAVALLSSEMEVVSLSSIYESEAWGFKSEKDFYNQVVIIRTHFSGEKVMEICLKIEKEMGRIRKSQFGYSDRNIDIDILYFGDRVISSDQLTVPHPRIQERNFVLVPMTEVAPDLVHPILHLTQSEMLRQLKDQGWIRKVDFDELKGNQ
ncbi:MAG: 2-amino-4-hydroxy-6-hydroxymethyldihydropteridine diphosphokinase [Bacteroidota bacterium]|nr:2-amino-4-hydroxy-6-hydroxymethyldihydropteridine diphosphokinase [Bacteroidota bacterium]MDX5447930.1 2-amino-4-hydroxy-6-hydroxymethyldihydropteridine diphosphokinase [Bacteroidota bacterium]MDX5504795.1 2-amino-4-hydroxy-6-hydroxymethyldihydropteridine diphosphokinase [Bacteroidota bacterium]